MSIYRINKLINRQNFSKFIAFVYVWVKYKTKKEKIVKNNKILIASDGHLGDLILASSAIVEIKKHFEARGKKYSFCASSQCSLF